MILIFLRNEIKLFNLLLFFKILGNGAPVNIYLSQAERWYCNVPANQLRPRLCLLWRT